MEETLPALNKEYLDKEIQRISAEIGLLINVKNQANTQKARAEMAANSADRQITSLETQINLLSKLRKEFFPEPTEANTPTETPVKEATNEPA